MVSGEGVATEVRMVEYDDVEPQAAFWRRHVRIGVSLYAAGAVGVIIYALATPNGPHRQALVAIDLFSLALSLTVFRWVGLRLVTTRWREQFFFAWSVATVVFIGSAAAIDGGTHSPLSYLLVLPLMFAALAYAQRYVIWLALLAVASAAGIGSATPHPQAAATLIMVLATAIAGILTVGGASNRARLNQQLVDMAALDSMTGCLARGAFNRRLAEEVDRARRYRRTFGLVMVDVDNLKRLNDTAGHRAGDEALRAVAVGLRAAARASDVVGRLGGDEFAVLLPETDAYDVETVLGRLRSVSYGEGEPAPVTLSLGSTVWSGPEDSAEAMFSRADDALYAAKHAGRARSVVWDPSTLHLQSSLPQMESDSTSQPSSSSQ
jgi:diguanylate cyclase (GGDEF)-like protein